MRQSVLNLQRWTQRQRQGTDEDDAGSSSSVHLMGDPTTAALQHPLPSSSSNTDIVHTSPKEKAAEPHSTEKLLPSMTQALPPSIDQNNSLTRCVGSEIGSFVGSQRTVKKGENVVTNSDEDEDSSSLEDIDEIFARRKILSDPPGASDEFKNFSTPQEPERSLVPERSRRSTGRRAVKRAPSPVQRPAYRYNLSVLAEQRKELDRSNQAVARANAILDPSNQHSTGDNVDSRPSENLLDTFLNDDENDEGIERLKIALRRTEALQLKRSWSFFHSHPTPRVEIAKSAPEYGDHLLEQYMENESTKQQALLGGVLSEHAGRRSLRPEVIQWMIKQAVTLDREDLRNAYSAVLAVAGTQLPKVFTGELLKELFLHVGARDEAVDTSLSVVPTRSDSSSFRYESKPQLLSLLDLVKNLSKYLKTEVAFSALQIICRLLLDHAVIYDGSLVASIEATVTGLIQSVHKGDNDSKLQDLVESIQKSVLDGSLRLQLLNNLASADMKAAKFRRKLATAFSYENTEIQRQKPRNPHTATLDQALQLLRSSRFDIHAKTDYTGIANHISILNLSVDYGDPPEQFSSMDEESEFNRAVDLIGLRLKELSAQIIDTGALNMGRTEAKEVIDNFLRRLNYTVRTEPPAKQTVLGSELDTFDNERRGMMNWVKPGHVI